MKSTISKKSFTLMELIIAMVIVGILASVAVPIMKKAIERAKKSEAITAMGLIRSAEMAYYSEYGNYKPIPSLYGPGGGGQQVANLIAIGFSTNDLLGTYFSYHCYTVDITRDYILCTPSLSMAPKYSEVNRYTGPIMNLNNGAVSSYY